MSTTTSPTRRMRTVIRAQQIVMWLGMFAGLGVIVTLVTRLFATGPGIERLPQVSALGAARDLGMTLGDLPVWVRGLCAAPELITTGALAVTAFLLSPLLLSVAGGAPFADVVGRNLRRIALVLVIAAAVSVAVDAAAQWQLGDAVDAFRDTAAVPGLVEGATFTPHLTIPWVLMGMAAVASTLRWTISDGAALEQEVEGVI